MKALMGELAKLIRDDSQGRKDLREFIRDGNSERVISLKNGKKYKISRERPVNDNKEMV